MAYQALFCDMDNTLLDENLDISPANKDAITALLARGKKFIICTGRGIYGVDRYIQELALSNERDGYVICQNGGTVYRLSDEKLVLERSFDIEALYPAIRAAQKFGVDIQLYYDRILMAEKITERIERYRSKMGTTITMLPNALEYTGKLTKCLLNGTRRQLHYVRNMVEDEIKGKLNMYFSDEEFLEFTALDANKGNAMLALASELSLNKKEIIALGDSENDESMIKMAGLGIAVRNAQRHTKQIAGYVTEADNTQDAVKEVIEKFML